MGRLRAMNLRTPLLNYGSQEASRIEAPTGTVYLVQTDVVDANELWDSVPMAMLESMSMIFLIVFLLF